MIRLALKNRSIYPYQWVLWGKDIPLPNGLEYCKFRCGISIVVCTTPEDQSQKEEYERITKTPESIIEWMRKHFQIQDISSLRIAGFVLDQTGDINKYVSFHPKHKDGEDHYDSESKIHLDNTTFDLEGFFQAEQIQLGIVDIVRNSHTTDSLSSPYFFDKMANAKELSIQVGPGEMISVMICTKDWKNTIGDYMQNNLKPLTHFPMLIPFPLLVEKHKLNIRGIVHIGANEGQELEAYLSKGVHNIVFIEPVPEVYEKLLKHVAIKANDKKHTIRCIKDLVLDVTGRSVVMNITDNNAESSSIFKMKEHTTAHPDVKVVGTMKMEGWSYDDLSDLYHIDPTLNFLNIDTQGAELLILTGMGEKINNFDYAYIEVNEKELYEGNPMLADIDAFMEGKGFVRKDLSMTDFGWGDALYIRKEIIAQPLLEKKDNMQYPITSASPKAPTPAAPDNTPTTPLGFAISETDKILESVKEKLSRDLSGSIADAIISEARTGFMNILNKYIKN